MTADMATRCHLIIDLNTCFSRSDLLLFLLMQSIMSFPIIRTLTRLFMVAVTSIMLLMIRFSLLYVTAFIGSFVLYEEGAIITSHSYSCYSFLWNDNSKHCHSGEVMRRCEFFLKILVPFRSCPGSVPRLELSPISLSQRRHRCQTLLEADLPDKDPFLFSI